jgi:hypothetical protein
MTQNKAILVATIGTRDLAFYAKSYQQWFNVGNDRKQDLEDSQFVKVQYELEIGEGENANFRGVTKHLLDNWETYNKELQPIIIGRLLTDKKADLKTVYLVATDQPNEPKYQRFYQKDTFYSAHIIKLWLETNYNIETKIFTQGKPDENPSSFEEMFSWWQKFWQVIAPGLNDKTELLLCLKGGVNQSSEAARITAISRFEEKVVFYDFIENEKENSQGIPSEYTAPFKGVNYLWSRKQSEALQLLERYDYEGVNTFLEPYYQDSNNEEIKKIKLWLKKAIKWNIADFETFANGLTQISPTNWWWKAYESAYLGVVRLQQGNTTEAFFHAFRAIEGLMSELIINKYNTHIETPKGETPYLKQSICQDKNHPEFKNLTGQFNYGKIYLYGSGLDQLLETTLPEIKTDSQWNRFFYLTKQWRNRLYHRLIKLPEGDLFNSWNVTNQQDWENNILYLLNYLSKQTYLNLKKASLMAIYHDKIKENIEKYYP